MRTSFAAGFVEEDRLLLFPVDEVSLLCFCSAGGERLLVWLPARGVVEEDRLLLFPVDEVSRICSSWY